MPRKRRRRGYFNFNPNFVTPSKINIDTEIKCNKFSVTDENHSHTNLSCSRFEVQSGIERGKLSVNNGVSSKNMHVNRINIANVTEGETLDSVAGSSHTQSETGKPAGLLNNNQGGHASNANIVGDVGNNSGLIEIVQDENSNVCNNVNLTKDVGQSCSSATRDQTQFKNSMPYTRIKNKKSNKPKKTDMSKFQTQGSGEGELCFTKPSHHYNFRKRQKKSYVEY